MRIEYDEQLSEANNVFLRNESLTEPCLHNTLNERCFLHSHNVMEQRNVTTLRND